MGCEAALNPEMLRQEGPRIALTPPVSAMPAAVRPLPHRVSYQGPPPVKRPNASRPLQRSHVSQRRLSGRTPHLLAPEPAAGYGLKTLCATQLESQAEQRGVVVGQPCVIGQEDRPDIREATFSCGAVKGVPNVVDLERDDPLRSLSATAQHAFVWTEWPHVLMLILRDPSRMGVQALCASVV